MIRTIEGRDAEAFDALLREVDASGFMLFEPGERKKNAEKAGKRIKSCIEGPNSTILLAEEDRRLAGYLIAMGGSVKRNRHSAYLVLGVSEDHRGKGIGTKLLEEIVQWGKSHGITRLELTVIKENNTAFQLYRKMGFVLEGEKVHSLMIDGKPVNEYYLYKLI